MDQVSFEHPQVTVLFSLFFPFLFFFIWCLCAVDIPSVKLVGLALSLVTVYTFYIGTSIFSFFQLAVGMKSLQFRKHAVRTLHHKAFKATRLP